jgi:hypothetical protein
MAYAEGTTVDFEKSIAEIIGMLRRGGADRIGQWEEPGQFTIQFFMKARLIQFRVQLPKLDTMPVVDGRNSRLTATQRSAKLEQAIKQRGRALMLVIKAKLESIESQVETFEEAFLANIVLADSRTVYERIAEPVRLEYESGQVEMLRIGGPN